MSKPAPVSPSTVIIPIQYLRGIAASFVVLDHAMSPTSLLPVVPTLRIGEFGVDLFFATFASRERGGTCSRRERPRS